MSLFASLQCRAGSYFDRQSNEYKESVLPSSITKRVSLEMGVSLGWERYVGQEGKVLSIETFGASGTGAEVMNLFGFTIENVVQITKCVEFLSYDEYLSRFINTEWYSKS